ncbi:hypothetical protein ABD97_21685 [Bacillus mycoides]|nr:hypothetical protein [Bacillus mycoides]
MKINKSRSYMRNVFLNRNHRSLNKFQDQKKSPIKFGDFMRKDTSIAFFFRFWCKNFEKIAMNL